MNFSFSDFAAALKAGQHISHEDVLAVRRWLWPDGSVSDDEAEVIFELNRLAGDAGPEWTAFFLEAMCDYVVNARPPKNYVDDEAAEWLIEQVGPDGAAPSAAADLELIVRILEKALNAPPVLKSWALGRIEKAVRADGRVGEDEAGQLRRILFAAGGDGALTVSQDEAEALWRIKDACLRGDNCPGWKILFCQAVGNYLMAHSSYQPLERNEAARLEAWVSDHKRSVAGFFGRMRAGAEIGDALREAFPKQASADEHEAKVDAARAVTSREQEWLDAHVEADGSRDDYEQALLDFIAEENREGSRAA